MHHVLERKNLLKDKNAFHGDTHILGLFLLYAMINDVKNKISQHNLFFYTNQDAKTLAKLLMHNIKVTGTQMLMTTAVMC